MTHNCQKKNMRRPYRKAAVGHWSPLLAIPVYSNAQDSFLSNLFFNDSIRISVILLTSVSYSHTHTYTQAQARAILFFSRFSKLFSKYILIKQTPYTLTTHKHIRSRKIQCSLNKFRSFDRLNFSFISVSVYVQLLVVSWLYNTVLNLC